MTEVNSNEYAFDLEHYYVEIWKTARESLTCIKDSKAKVLYSSKIFSIRRKYCSGSVRYFRLTDEEIQYMVLPRII